MKIRTGFVSNSSTSSFLVTDTSLGVNKVKKLVEKAAQAERRHNIDHIEYNLVDEEFCQDEGVWGFFSFLDDKVIDPYSSCNDLWNQFTKAKDDETRKKLRDQIDAQQEQELAANHKKIAEFVKSDEFQNKYKGMVHIVGDKNDEFIQNLYDSPYFSDKGYHVHLG